MVVSAGSANPHSGGGGVHQAGTRAPSERPSCGEVLAELLVEKLWWRRQPEGGNALELVVADLHSQAARLQGRLREREAEVAALRALLAEKGVSAGQVEAAVQRRPSSMLA